MMAQIPACIQRTILTGGVLLDVLGTGVGGGITDTIDTISSPIIILGNITVTTNLPMLGTIRLTMLYAILKNLTMVENTVETNSLDLSIVQRDSMGITVEVDSIEPLAMVEDMVKDTDELV